MIGVNHWFTLPRSGTIFFSVIWVPERPRMFSDVRVSVRWDFLFWRRGLGGLCPPSIFLNFVTPKKYLHFVFVFLPPVFFHWVSFSPRGGGTGTRTSNDKKVPSPQSTMMLTTEQHNAVVKRLAAVLKYLLIVLQHSFCLFFGQTSTTSTPLSASTKK